MANWYWRDGSLAVATDDPLWLQKMSEIEKKLSDLSYKVLRQEHLPGGKWISTVWLGLDHSFSGPPPLIFETMVFATRNELSGLDQRRYSTEALALTGHEEMKAEWTKRGMN